MNPNIWFMTLASMAIGALTVSKQAPRGWVLALSAIVLACVLATLILVLAGIGVG